MYKTITHIKVTSDKEALTRVWDATYAEQHAGKTYRAVLNDGWAECSTVKFPVGTVEDLSTGKVIITEMHDEEELYEVSFEGSADDFGFSDQTDELEGVDAFEIAVDVAGETNSAIVWENAYAPAWFC